MSDRLYEGSEVAIGNLLENARRQAAERGYDRFPIVDVDAHHYEGGAWKEIVAYMDEGPVKEWATAVTRRYADSAAQLTGVQHGNQQVSGRILRPSQNIPDTLEGYPEGRHADVARMVWAMDMIGIDYAILFPTPMLNLGLHPQVETEVALAHAYCRWLTGEFLPQNERLKTMIYLPFNDPAASLAMVEEFGERPGVVGFMVSAVRYRQVHHNDYAPLYRAIEASGKPLGFHAAYNWAEPSMAQLNKFMSVHALGFTFTNMIHITNWVVNGLPERFPELKVIWIESGVAWAPFLMQRLDTEYLMRTSEAPLLRKVPSEYMREMYWASQPLERTRNARALEVAFEMIDAPNRLLYSSDYPHWDCDMPSVIYDLPFLREEEKRNILGGNACRLFGIEPILRKAPSAPAAG